jgi:putative nucleotidyltransferase with HDIG domain
LKVSEGGAGDGLSPEVEELLDAFEQRTPQRFSRRERIVETAMAVSFLAVAVAMAAFLHSGRPLALSATVALVVAYAITSRVKFPIGYGFTVPTQLVFIPMLFLLPAEAVPLLVAAGISLGNVPDYLRRTTHPDRTVSSFGDSWHSVGPALVVALAGSPDPTWSAWPLYAAILAAQFASDGAASTVRDGLALGISPKLQPELLGWVFLVDLLLTPIGLLAAVAGQDDPYAALLTLPLAGLLVVFARERKTRIGQALDLSRAYRGTTLLLGDVLEADDEYTGVHSRSVVSLSVAVADEMGLDSRARRNVEFGALLHDVGKIAIPTEMINKPGPLTDAEWVVMKTHTIEGQRMLDQVGGVLSEVGQVVRSSHERWDGAGYPDGLAGEEIPLPSAIVSCCDAFNAMTTDRAYRPAMSSEEALMELRTGAGSQFHPRVVEVLAAVIERSTGTQRQRRALPVGD